MNIKAAIFDMDGTLIDSLMFWDFYWSNLGKKYFNDASFKPHPEDAKKVRTLTIEGSTELICNSYSTGGSYEELLSFGRNCVVNFYLNDIKLKDGVIEFLDYCLDNDIKMCIASATELAHLEIAIERFKIGKYFSKVISCGDLGKGKEEPDVFLAALEFLGTEIDETWVFEDSLVAIETAAKIGLPTVAVYDKLGFGQERMKEIATEYIGPGETLKKLIRDYN